ncbi:MAG: hypothetical protein ACXADW_22170 [Candidatus Hodarchaeales archaeon]
MVVVLLLVISLSFAEDKISIEDIYGTWVNSDYNEKGQIAKVVINHDGSEFGYHNETSTEYYLDAVFS